MLSDNRIRQFIESGDIAFTDEDGDPLALDDSQFQPVSIDLRLGDVRMWFGRWSEPPGPLHWSLQPFRFSLASTLEVVTLSDRVAATVVGKSSVARRGLQVEAAGLVDPGFSGQLTLELIHFGEDMLSLTEGVPICQIVFFEVDGTVLRPYGSDGLRSRYQGQLGPTPAREDPPCARS